jgi:hypothetical protein
LDHKWFKKFSPKDKEKNHLKKRNLNAFKKYMKNNKLQQAALTAVAV